MSDRFWPSETRMDRLRPFFPKSRGKPRVDDRRVPSRMIFIRRNGLMWKPAPREYGPPKTRYDRWKRWSRMGVFATIMTELAAQARDTEMVMIDATQVTAHRTASSPARFKRGAPCGSGTADRAHKGRTERETARPRRREGPPDPDVPVGGQTSDYIGARALPPSIPQAAILPGDRGHDADWFRNALIEMGISPRIPSRAGRRTPIQHDTDLCRLRHKIEIMFARLKDWRRIATRYDRSPILVLSACALATTVGSWW